MNQRHLGLTDDQINFLIEYYEKNTNSKAVDILVKQGTKSTDQQLKYIYGIMKNRFFEGSVMSQGILLLHNAVEAGVSVHDLQVHAKGCGSWTHFRESVEALMTDSK